MTVALATCLAALLASPAAARAPQVTVPRAKLAAAFHCSGRLAGATREPILLSTGTGSTGGDEYALMKPALDRYGHPVCYVDYPQYATADVQVSVQYLVYAIRRTARAAGRPIVVYGISQGALLPRIAITYWPGLAAQVTDVIAAAGTQHGTTAGRGGCSASSPCAPALWQQMAGSDFLRALNRQPDESPGATAWTTVRSLSDQVVQPQGGRHPTSALRGASNILIQSVCPGRNRDHVGTVADSVTFAALVDAVAHRGPARVARSHRTSATRSTRPGSTTRGRPP
jgi:hypothetical protein